MINFKSVEGNNLCNMCIQDLIDEEGNKSSFTCKFCNELHYTPMNGFISNKVLSELVNEVTYTEKIDELKERLDDIFERSRFIYKNTQEEINNIKSICENIREKIQVAKDTALKAFKDRIDKMSQDLLDEVNLHEREKTEKLQEFADFDIGLIGFCDRWEKYLDTPNIDLSEITKAIRLASRFETSLEEYEKELDSYSSHKGSLQFIPNESGEIEVDKDFLGSISLQENKDSLKHTFKTVFYKSFVEDQIQTLKTQILTFKDSHILLAYLDTKNFVCLKMITHTEQLIRSSKLKNTYSTIRLCNSAGKNFTIYLQNTLKSEKELKIFNREFQEVSTRKIDHKIFAFDYDHSDSRTYCLVDENLIKFYVYDVKLDLVNVINNEQHPLYMYKLKANTKINAIKVRFGLLLLEYLDRSMDIIEFESGKKKAELVLCGFKFCIENKRKLIVSYYSKFNYIGYYDFNGQTKSEIKLSNIPSGLKLIDSIADKGIFFDDTEGQMIYIYESL